MKMSIRADALYKRLARMNDLAQDARPILLTILDTPFSTNPLSIIGGFGAAFVSQGASLGKQWEKLSPRYAEWKARVYGPATILYRTGRLFYSLAQGTEETVKILGPRSLSYGTTVPYAMYHQSEAARHRLPRRQFSKITDDQREAWKILIKKYFATARGSL